MARPATPRLAPRDVIAALARLLAAAGPSTATIGGRVAFVVEGEGGGRWMVDLGVPGGDWAGGEDASSATTIRAPADAFSAIIFDPAAIRGLVARGVISVEGDTAKLARIARMIAAGGSPLEQRTRAARRPSSRARKGKHTR